MFDLLTCRIHLEYYIMLCHYINIFAHVPTRKY